MLQNCPQRWPHSSENPGSPNWPSKWEICQRTISGKKPLWTKMLTKCSCSHSTQFYLVVTTCQAEETQGGTRRKAHRAHVLRVPAHQRSHYKIVGSWGARKRFSRRRRGRHGRKYGTVQQDRSTTWGGSEGHAPGQGPRPRASGSGSATGFYARLVISVGKITKYWDKRTKGQDKTSVQYSVPA